MDDVIIRGSCFLILNFILSDFMVYVFFICMFAFLVGILGFHIDLAVIDVREDIRCGVFEMFV